MEENNSFKKASSFARMGLKEDASDLAELLGVTLPGGEDTIKEERREYNHTISLQEIIDYITGKGMRITDRFIKRYHLSLINKGFVILSGISGTGKTWLSELYASAIGAEYLLVPVAPNWTTNEDLLGFYNPLDNHYKHTPFSLFLKQAQLEYEKALEEQRPPIPYHVVLDEMNLARVEYYFAKFLSLLEIRNRGGRARIETPPEGEIMLTPNLFFIGTINVDETTHGFADKIYDRAQLLEVGFEREDILAILDEVPYKEIVIQIWDTIHEIAPFAYRVIGDMKKYIADAEKIGMSWEESLDEQILQKVLPKIKGTDIEVGTKLEELRNILEAADFQLSLKKVEKMMERYSNYGVATYF
jgi:hypothetical protein